GCPPLALSAAYQRIVGELRKLGVAVSASSARNILGKAGLPPAPPPAILAQLPASTCRVDPRLRLFTVDTVWLRRFVRARLRLDRQEPRRVPGLHQQAEYRVDAAADSEPADGARRSRHQVPAHLRCPASKRRNQGHPHACPGAKRERTDGAPDRQCPPRMPRPA